MAESKAEMRLREIEITAKVMETRIETQDRETQALRANEHATRIGIMDLRRELAELRQEFALLRQRFEDQRKHAEEWERRRWGSAG